MRIHHDSARTQPRGYGFTAEPAELGWYAGRVAEAWGELMPRLGYTRYVAQGGDAGAAVTDAMGRQAPEGLIGIHTNLFVPGLAGGAVPKETEEERAAAEAGATFRATGFGYFLEQTTRPQSIGYALLDSPVALAAWMLDHDADSYYKISRAFVERQPVGGHFAAWEEPELFATEMWAAFSSLAIAACAGGPRALSACGRTPSGWASPPSARQRGRAVDRRPNTPWRGVEGPRPSIWMVLGWSEDVLRPNGWLGHAMAEVDKSEKITINVGVVDLGQIDLLVTEGFFGNRTDFIRTAIRRQLESRSNVLESTVARRELVLGSAHYDRHDLEALRDSGRMVELRVLGLASIADDVSAELAVATIAAVEVLGAFRASRAVKAALASRTR